MEAEKLYDNDWMRVADHVGHGVNTDRCGCCYMEISSFLLFDDDDDVYSTAILSCRLRWKYQLKPKIDGYKIPRKITDWSPEMVCFVYHLCMRA